VPRCPETACRAAAGLDRPLPPRSPVPLRARGCAKLEKPAVPPEFAVPALRFAGRSTLCSSCASLLYTPPEARRSRAHEAFQLGSAQSSVFSIGSPYIWRTVILVLGEDLRCDLWRGQFTWPNSAHLSPSCAPSFAKQIAISPPERRASRLRYWTRHTVSRGRNKFLLKDPASFTIGPKPRQL
jgi:hypothetical protein